MIVFPTLVGVFLGLYAGGSDSAGLPHARGGVSAACHAACLHMASSPRSWGCFSMRARCGYKSDVFPTLVGVFLF